MVDFGAAIKRPFTNFRSLSIGAVLYFIPYVIGFILFLIIIPDYLKGNAMSRDLYVMSLSAADSLKIQAINIVTAVFGVLFGIAISGYALRCAKTAMNRDFRLPGWDKRDELLRSGLLATAISIIYLLPALILFLTAYVMFLLPLKGTGYTLMSAGSMAASLLVGILIMVFALILLLFTVILLPMALMNFIRQDRFSAAFDLKAVTGKAFTGKYLGAIGVQIAYGILLFLIILIPIIIFVFIPYLGELLTDAFMAAIMMLLMISGYTMYGQAYRELEERGGKAQTHPARQIPAVAENRKKDSMKREVKREIKRKK